MSKFGKRLKEKFWDLLEARYVKQIRLTEEYADLLQQGRFDEETITKPRKVSAAITGKTYAEVQKCLKQIRFYDKYASGAKEFETLKLIERVIDTGYRIQPGEEERQEKARRTLDDSVKEVIKQYKSKIDALKPEFAMKIYQDKLQIAKEIRAPTSICGCSRRSARKIVESLGLAGYEVHGHLLSDYCETTGDSGVGKYLWPFDMALKESVDMMKYTEGKDFLKFLDMTGSITRSYRHQIEGKSYYSESDVTMETLQTYLLESLVGLAGEKSKQGKKHEAIMLLDMAKSEGTQSGHREALDEAIKSELVSALKSIKSSDMDEETRDRYMSGIRGIATGYDTQTAKKIVQHIDQRRSLMSDPETELKSSIGRVYDEKSYSLQEKIDMLTEKKDKRGYELKKDLQSMTTDREKALRGYTDVSSIGFDEALKPKISKLEESFKKKEMELRLEAEKVISEYDMGIRSLQEEYDKVDAEHHAMIKALQQRKMTRDQYRQLMHEKRHQEYLERKTER
ncbi:MAG: hypothetical protein ACP5NW_05710 [Candidatus Woesearchaeota archaeon]